MRNKCCFAFFILCAVLNQGTLTSAFVRTCFKDLDQLYSTGYYYDELIHKCVKFFQHYFKVNEKYVSREKCLQNRDPDYFNHLKYVFDSVYYYDKKTGFCSRLFYSKILHQPVDHYLTKEQCENTCLD